MQQRYSSNLFSGVKDGERVCAMSLGVLFLFLGIAGFIPGLVAFPDVASNAQLSVPNLTFTDGYGNVLGLFPTNFLHNAVHIAVGILGIAAATSHSGALVFNQAFAIVYAAIVIMGLLPFTNTTFGIMPVFGNNIWLNALTGAAAGYYGFFVPAKQRNVGATSNI